MRPRFTTRRRVVPAVALAAVVLAPLGSPQSAQAVAPRSAVVLPGPEVGALRSVPGYAAAAHRSARMSSGSGPVDTVTQVPTAQGSTPIYGDWDADGATTPGTFAGGTWTLWNVVVGRAPAAGLVVVGFGAMGDQPVTGDWNGDGRTDIGIYRDGQFTLAVLTAGGSITRRLKLAYGQPGDVAVVGDWDADASTDVGVRRGNTFYLHTPSPPPLTPTPSPSASRPTPSASPTPTPAPVVVPVPGIPVGDAVIPFGSASDEPVIGDWNADGTDTVGVVRGGAWLLRDDLYPGEPTVRNVTREVGATPLPWRVPVGDGTSCPYLASTRVEARHDTNATWVNPVYGTHLAMPGVDVEGKLQLSLQTAERYLMGAGHTSQTYVRQPYSDPLQRTSRTIEEAIRLPAMRAATLAIGLSTQTWDSASLGTTQRGSDYVRWLVRTISCTHASLTPGGWGYSFETAHWAMLTAFAAWLEWPQLAPQEQEYVATMLVAESDYLLTQPVLYQRDRSGNDLTPGDTRAEEDSWNAAALELSVAMMPDHPRASLWRRKAVDLATAAFARPADLSSASAVNGTPLSERLQGTNASDDGSVLNNSILTGDYVSTVQQNLWGAAFAQLGQGEVLEGALVDVDAVWGAMTQASYVRTEPDGTTTTSTMYRPDGLIFFPQGSRWGTVRRAQFASLDAFRLLTARTYEARQDALNWLNLHIDGQLALQNRHPDGRTFDPGEDNYPGREEYAASQVAFAWLAVYVDAWLPVDRVDRGTYPPLPLQTPRSQPLSRGVRASLSAEATAAGRSNDLIAAVGAISRDPAHATP